MCTLQKNSQKYILKEKIKKKELNDKFDQYQIDVKPTNIDEQSSTNQEC